MVRKGVDVMREKITGYKAIIDEMYHTNDQLSRSKEGFRVLVYGEAWNYGEYPEEVFCDLQDLTARFDGAIEEVNSFNKKPM